MQQRHNSAADNSLLVPLITFFCAAVFAGFVVSRLQVADLRNQQAHAKNLVAQVANNLRAIMDEYFDNTQFWRTVINRNNGKVVSFDILAEAIHSGDPCIDSIQLSPEGIVTYSYPPSKENEGTDLFKDPIHHDDAKYALLTKLVTITGPFPQRRGGSGLAIRTPIYITNSNGTDTFWGFSTIILRAAEIFKAANLSELEDDNYDYQLKAINPHKGKLEMVDCSTYNTLNNPVSYNFDIHNTAWAFYVTPKNGWRNSSILLFEILVAVIFATLLSFSANSLWKLIKRESTFKKLSYIDSLTKLYNTRKFYEMLTDLYRKVQPFAIVYIDLNKFKPVNDTYGHKSGDELLCIVAKKLKNCIRQGDEVFRIGGDEFTIILPNEMTIGGLANLVQRIKASVGRPTVLGNTTVNITASIGYARYPQDGSSFENIIQISEEMMYADKKFMNEER